MSFKGMIIECNSATVDLFNYEKDEFIGKNLLEFISFPSKSLILLENTYKQLIKGQKLNPIEIQCYTKEGKLIEVKVSSSLVKLHNEILIQVIIQDISKVKLVGFKDLRFIRKKWDRQISFQYAIKPKTLGYYVSKYASKTPFFDYETNRQYYHLLVYKTQTHRFSCKPENIVLPYSDWGCLDAVSYEVKRALYRDSYLNPNARNRYYFEYLEPKPDPTKTFSFKSRYFMRGSFWDFSARKRNPEIY